MVLKLSEGEIEELVSKVDFKKMNGLVPVVVQDKDSEKVLMQAFMNEEALKLTLKTGKMHYWSRTKRRVWLKGEESGHYSIVENVILDCDNDAILFKVHQIGVCCHTGEESCFHNSPFSLEGKGVVNGRFLEKIYEVIVERIENFNEKSYVSKLSSEGEDAILQKIGEEAFELVLASKKSDEKEVVFEASDLIFHVLILLANKGISLKKIFKELEERHKAKTACK
ncbi:bifunctional phosphoribosyl-AMP cyclohydrolase/phosphoribosyl-ATP diphosphatase HisIE [Candidatus Bathyarchaeota archaeon]|nr:bifunctional phosphoribosyl-AMP cyclohydrolase/phosphoribosyl-ATP diphosphatase HisIE [Candidatus Bathyarchaeota archaeon]